MAEFKNGKINGKIGPLVYRYLNDKTIIQAAPRRIKPRGGTIVENEKFGEASHFTSAVYESLKEFGLNRCYSYLFGRLVSYFKKVFYSDLKDQKLGEYVNLDKKDDLSKLFSSYPKAEKDANIISVHVPSINVKGKDKKYAKANFMNYEVKLFLFDMDYNGFYTVYEYGSPRVKLEDGIDKQDIYIDLNGITHELDSEVPLSDFGVSTESSVVMVGFIIYFYSYSHSSVFLNSKEFNPVAILGAWRVAGG